MNSLITILISVRNGSETLNRCFESILNQTYKHFSIVCINDFSTDNGKTIAILSEWKNKFSNNQFVVINNKSNLGLTKSLNNGLKIIKSEYTARIDADDWWHSKKLEKQIIFLKNHPDCGVLGCNYINFGKSFSKKIFLPEKDSEIRKTLPRKNPFAHSCVIFKTELIKKLGGYDETVKYGQDYELWWKCYPYTKFHNLSNFLCHRKTGGGISIEKQKEQMKQGMKTQFKYFRKYNLPLRNYIYVIKLLIIAIVPDFIKKIKRNNFG